MSIKKNLSERFNKTQEGLINALDNKENQLLRMKQIFEKRISLLNQKNSEEFLTQKKNFSFQKKLNDTDTKQLLSDKQSEFRTTIKSMKNNFDKKMSSIKNKNDIFVNKLTDRYESLLKSERSNNHKAMSRKDRWAQGEISRLRRQAKLEKNSLIQQYELKLDKIKQATALNKEINNSNRA